MIDNKGKKGRRLLSFITFFTHEISGEIEGGRGGLGLYANFLCLKLMILMLYSEQFRFYVVLLFENSFYDCLKSPFLIPV